MSYYVGIDIGGTKIAAGIVTNVGEVLLTKHCPTPVQLGGPKILQDAIALAAQLLKESGKEVSGVGIGAGGQIDSEQGLVHRRSWRVDGSERQFRVDASDELCHKHRYD